MHLYLLEKTIKYVCDEVAVFKWTQPKKSDMILCPSTQYLSTETECRAVFGPLNLKPIRDSL